MVVFLIPIAAAGYVYWKKKKEQRFQQQQHLRQQQQSPGVKEEQPPVQEEEHALSLAQEVEKAHQEESFAFEGEKISPTVSSPCDSTATGSIFEVTLPSAAAAAAEAADLPDLSNLPSDSSSLSSSSSSSLELASCSSPFDEEQEQQKQVDVVAKAAMLKANISSLVVATTEAVTHNMISIAHQVDGENQMTASAASSSIMVAA